MKEKGAVMIRRKSSIGRWPATPRSKALIDEADYSFVIESPTKLIKEIYHNIECNSISSLAHILYTAAADIRWAFFNPQCSKLSRKKRTGYLSWRENSRLKRPVACYSRRIASDVNSESIETSGIKVLTDIYGRGCVNVMLQTEHNSPFYNWQCLNDRYWVLSLMKWLLLLHTCWSTSYKVTPTWNTCSPFLSNTFYKFVYHNV